MWEAIKRHWGAAVGWLSTAYGVVRLVLDHVGYVDTLMAHSDWIHHAVEFLRAPPEWLVVPIVVVGLLLIWWDSRRTASRNRPIPAWTENEAPVERTQYTPSIPANGDPLWGKDYSRVAKLVPIMEAAQFVYDETRHSAIAELTRMDKGNGYDNPIVKTANLIFRHVPLAYGSVYASTRLDPIAAPSKKNMVIFEDGVSAGHAGERDARVYNIHVRETDLQECINFIKRVSEMKT